VPRRHVKPHRRNFFSRWQLMVHDGIVISRSSEKYAFKLGTFSRKSGLYGRRQLVRRQLLDPHWLDALSVH
jgi:hypothetical protein